MKRLGVLLGLVSAIGLGALAAGDPFDMTVTWSGAGSVSGTVVAGNTLATTTWGSFGNFIQGTFKATYTVGYLPGSGSGVYNGNSFSTSIDAYVSGGGWIELLTERGALGYTGGGTSEPGGQKSYSWVWTKDGTASMKTATSTGAVFITHTGWDAGLFDRTYGWVGQNDHNITAAGTEFAIIRKMMAANGNYVQVQVSGSGSAALDAGMSSASDSRSNKVALAYASGYLFGWNQDFSATGTGVLQLLAYGSSEATFYNVTGITGADPSQSWGGWVGILVPTADGKGLTVTGAGALGSAQLFSQVGWNSSLYYPNLSMSAK